MPSFCLEVSGPFACFTRPEMKVERVSYDVMTPSAARAVFEAMIAQWPDEFYEDDKGKIYDLFPCGRKGNAFLGEDISFCQRAKECGFDIWAVQGTNLLHSGEKTWPAKWQLDVQVSA